MFVSELKYQEFTDEHIAQHAILPLVLFTLYIWLWLSKQFSDYAYKTYYA